MIASMLLLLTILQPPGDLLTQEVQKLGGTWQIISSETDGKEKNDRVKGFRYHFEGQLMKLLDKQNKPILRADGKPDERPFLINVQTNPKTIDMTIQVKTKAFLSLGIYRLLDDELTLCFAEPGATRPTEFTSKPGVTLILLHRVKK